MSEAEKKRRLDYKKNRRKIFDILSEYPEKTVIIVKTRKEAEALSLKLKENKVGNIIKQN